jgi:hypothetical protein
MKRLEYEADAAPAKQRACRVVEAGNVRPVKEDAAGVRSIETRDHVEERRLADAGLSDDRDVFTALNFERDTAQHCARPRTAIRF